MDTRFKNCIAVLSALTLLATAAVTAAPARAAEHGQGPRGEARSQGRGQARGQARGFDHGGRGPAGRPGRIVDGRGYVLDNRYNHGRYYPRSGTVRRELPDGYRPYFYRGSRYYFYGGIWYAPSGIGFAVVRPPIGLLISVLPPYYSTVWIGGFPYYYADDVYYSWEPAQNGYVVVDPPAGAEQPSAPPAAASDDLIIYPKNGQNADQQAADRYECHRWSKTQTGFDPTEAGGGVAPAEHERARSEYLRAMSACLAARGYEVK